MSRLDKVKEIITEYYDEAKGGLFFTKNTVGDRMFTIYCRDNITVDICYNYAYFEVFGLNSEEEEELTEFYSQLGEAYDNWY